MNTFICDVRDRQWLGALGFASADDLDVFRSKQVAAVSHSSDTFEVHLDPTLAAGAPRRVFVKRYRYRSWKALLRGCFRGTLFGKSRARIEFEVLGEMRRRGVRVVRPIAYAEKRRWRILRRCVLITEGESDSQTLSPYYSRRLPAWDLSTRRRFIRAAGRSVAQMHEAGVVHGGLFWRNVLVTETADDGWAFTFLDPSRRFRLYSHAVPLPAKVADLSDFVASAAAFQSSTDLARFLRSYEGPKGRREDRRSAARAIVRQAKKKTGQEAHRLGVGIALSWLQQRIQRSASGHVTFDSVEGFFSALEGADLGGRDHRNAVLRFELRGPGAVDEVKIYSVKFGHDRVHVEEASVEAADLVIRTDECAWLALVNAQRTAFDAIRSGRFEMRGDTQLLALLAKLIDTPALSARRATTTSTASCPTGS